jgi:hypothetical protein
MQYTARLRAPGRVARPAVRSASKRTDRVDRAFAADGHAFNNIRTSA